MKLRARNLNFDIQRFEEVEGTGHIIVEGYAFVNPDAGDGFIWERQAMEAATPDYQQWGAVREMHQPSAVGTASGEGLGVTWDDKGAKIRALIVDESAVDKVKTGVYKGFSAKIKPTMMRGNAVKQCVWIENSLVDRPQDKDCPIERFALLRLEDADEEEFEVAEEQQRASFADYMADYAGSQLRSMALDWLWNALWDIQNGDGEDKAGQVRETCQQFTDFMVQVVEGGTLTLDLDEDGRAEILRSLTDDEVKGLATERGITSTTPNLPIRENLEGGKRRFERSDEDGMDLDAVLGAFNDFQQRLDTAEAQSANDQARIEELERKAKPVAVPPVRFPEAMERTFAAVHQQNHKAKAELEEEFSRLEREAPLMKGEKDRQNAAWRMQVIKSELAALS